MKHSDATTSRRHGVTSHRTYTPLGWWTRRIAYIVTRSVLYVSVGIVVGVAVVNFLEGAI